MIQIKDTSPAKRSTRGDFRTRDPRWSHPDTTNQDWNGNHTRARTGPETEGVDETTTNHAHLQRRFCPACRSRLRRGEQGLECTHCETQLPGRETRARTEAAKTESNDVPCVDNGDPCETSGRSVTRQTRSESRTGAEQADRIPPLPTAASEMEQALWLGRLFAGEALGLDARWFNRHLDTGQALDQRTRDDMEKRFGEDLSKVRIHEGRDSELMARTLNARAFTVGQDIVFRRGEYNPDTRTGRELLMHELTHALQQREASAPKHGLLPITRRNHTLEQQAQKASKDTDQGHKRERGVSLSPVASVHVSPSFCEIMVSAAVAAGFSAIVAAIGALCTAGSVITVGGLAIPCTALIIGAAAAGAANIVLWTAILQHEICGTPLSDEQRRRATQSSS